MRLIRKPEKKTDDSKAPQKAGGQVRRTVALFGGAFDPVHNGHVAIVKKLITAKRVDKILVIPVAKHPWGKKLSSFPRRVAMCRLALASLHKSVTMSLIEAKLRGPGYTVRTLRMLAQRHPATDFILVIGADSYKERGQWKDFDKIRGLADLMVFRRGPRSEIPNVSSTEIRKRLAEGKSIDDLVPAPVAQYIAKKKLYKENRRG